ncbi:hypothetical protein BpHYR1_036760 [Brachionus plicatilis]|uniref:Uncharacterized protein n=1 Tax=Brachionus plicatilis TaxID=10195 RepID=A0A3M7QL09_BRAPC|nr:hypothetical protein BpHYR1_036760 [Brachionus plicatilis]
MNNKNHNCNLKNIQTKNKYTGLYQKSQIFISGWEIENKYKWISDNLRFEWNKVLLSIILKKLIESKQPAEAF